MERGWRMVRKFKVRVNGKEYLVEVEEISEGRRGASYNVSAPTKSVEAPQEPVVKQERPQEKVQEKVGGEPAGEKAVKAPMSGIVMKVLVGEGQQVSVGDVLLVFEAMKMENELRSEYSGRVKKILVKEGDSIETGQTLLVIE